MKIIGITDFDRKILGELALPLVGLTVLTPLKQVTVEMVEFLAFTMGEVSFFEEGILDPCPICGHKGTIIMTEQNCFFPEVQCSNSNCETQYRSGAFKTIKQAVAAWNGITANIFRQFPL